MTGFARCLPAGAYLFITFFPEEAELFQLAPLCQASCRSCIFKMDEIFNVGGYSLNMSNSHIIG